jgi:cobalt-zinc-cadmium efflux system outer membrane protein
MCVSANDYSWNELRSYPRRSGEQRNSGFCRGHRRFDRLVRCCHFFLLFTLFVQPILAQQQSSRGLKSINPGVSAVASAQQQTPIPTTTRSITISDAVSIFLQQNLQLVAARYDVDTVDAEKITARLRPNPEVSVGFSDIPLAFRDNFVKPQTFSYGISQTFELGAKRQKRIDAANADSEVARAEFQTVVWQLTNDLKKKFYAVLLADSLLKVALENQKTFAEIVKHTNEVFQLGEISGLDLQRLEVEKLKFDTDVANSEKDYELALRDLRVTLGGDYRTMEIQAAGTID